MPNDEISYQLAKAFDRVNRIIDIVGQWFKSYFPDEKQQLERESPYSNYSTPTGAV
jgi:hypothetical protein